MKNPKLYIASTGIVSRYPDEYFKIHFPKRYERSGKYRQKGDYLRCLCSAVLIKEVLGIAEKDLSVGEYGKPFCETSEYCFNLSHSGDYCALAVFSNDIGVDIELRRKTVEKNVRRLLTPDEYNFAQSDPDNIFFDFWTMKESLCKYFGYGLKMRITDINVLPMLKNGNMVYGGIKLYGKNISLKNYSLSLCSDREFNAPEIEYL